MMMSNFVCNFNLASVLTKKLGLHPSATAYAATTLATAFMHPVFTFYYVKIFLDRYKIADSQFQVAQVVYMVWNSVNDPLFGYLQDNWDHYLVRSRRHTIMYGAPLWALSFLVPWFPWGDYQPGSWLCGLHLITSLCFYDALFTYVLLANCCVFAESSEAEEDRIRCLQYQNFASLIGSISIFFCEQMSSHLDNYFMFQLSCVVLAVLAWRSLLYAGKNAVTLYDLKSVKSDDGYHGNGEALTSERGSSESMFKLTWQILANRNFFWFVICNFLSEIHNNFLANFISIITDALVPRDYLPAFLWHAYYGSIYFLPRLALVLSRGFIGRVGYYRIFRYGFASITIMGVLVFCMGSSYHGIFISFVVIDGLLASYLGSLGMMPLSDVVDDDMHKYNRKHPMSSMVFGTNALVTKPGISIAPMFVVYMLNIHGYAEYKDGTLPMTSHPALKDTMFTLMCLIPAACGLVQSLLWTQYKFKNSKSSLAKYTDA